MIGVASKAAPSLRAGSYRGPGGKICESISEPLGP